MRDEGLRIAIFGLNYAPEPTGIAPYTTGIAQGLRRAGHDVRVVTGYPHYPAWKVHPGYSGLRMTENLDGVLVDRLRHVVPRSGSGPVRVLLELTFAAHSLLARVGPVDVVIAVTPSLFGAGALRVWSALRRNRPAVGVVVQDIYSRAVVETGAFGGRGAALVHAVESHVLQGADGVAVIHDRFREQMVGSLGVRAENVTVIRNWSHVDVPDVPSSMPMLARERFGWSEDEVVILHAGNMGAKQGLENIVDAAALADERGENVRFVLLGDGNQRRTLQARGAGIRRLQFIDTLPDEEFFGALGAADVLIVNERPGVAEMSVPSKLTTYFAMGKPVLAATEAHSGTAFEIAASEAGVRVEPGRPDELIAAALALAADPVEAKRLAAAGRSYVERVLSETTAIEAYDAWVRALARGRRY